MWGRLVPAMSGYVDYTDLPPRLKAEARALRPKWARTEFRRFAFWVKSNGHLSRRLGHHILTVAACTELLGGTLEGDWPR